MDEKAKKKGFKFGDIFAGFGKKKEKEEAPVVENDRLEEPVQHQRSVSVDADSDIDQALINLREGALFDLWKRYAGGFSTLRISLRGVDNESLPLDDAQLKRERVRLLASLERDAKKRIRELDDYQKQCTAATDEYHKKRAEAEEESEKAAIMLELPPPLEAQCHVYISKDYLVAWAILFPPSDGDVPLSNDVFSVAMENAKVTTGLDYTAVENRKPEELYMKLFPLAKGRPVTPGEDGRIVEHFARKITKEVQIDERGVADYRNLNIVQVVSQGAVICDIIPPIPGIPGERIDGKPIEPKSVRAAKVPKGINTIYNEDGTQLIAGIDGSLTFVNDVFQVRPLLEIAGDVDYKTGNIDFRGDVHIHGTVREGFKIRATGNISIDGVVEAAEIESGGNITVKGGISGDNCGKITCVGNLQSKYIENSLVYAGKCVYAECIISSRVYSDDTIEVTEGRAAVIGGTLTAGYFVKIGNLGSQSERKTQIHLGELSFNRKKIDDAHAGLEELERELEKVNSKIRYLEANEDEDDDYTVQVSQLKVRRTVLDIRRKKFESDIQKLGGVEVDISKCRLECKSIYPNSFLYIGEASWQAKDLKRRCAVMYDTYSGEFEENIF